MLHLSVLLCLLAVASTAVAQYSDYSSGYNYNGNYNNNNYNYGGNGYSPAYGQGGYDYYGSNDYGASPYDYGGGYYGGGYQNDYQSNSYGGGWGSNYGMSNDGGYNDYSANSYSNSYDYGQGYGRKKRSVAHRARRQQQKVQVGGAAPFNGPSKTQSRRGVAQNNVKSTATISRQRASFPFATAQHH